MGKYFKPPLVLWNFLIPKCKKKKVACEKKPIVFHSFSMIFLIKKTACGHFRLQINIELRFEIIHPSLKYFSHILDLFRPLAKL